MTPAAGDEKTPLTDAFIAALPPVRILHGDDAVETGASVRALMVAYGDFARQLERELTVLRSSPSANSDAGAMREAAARVCDNLNELLTAKTVGFSEAVHACILLAEQIRALPVGKAEARVENPFLREVCESLFGCFINPSADGNHTCALCAEPIDVLSWTAAEHDSDCIINRVREHLWAVVPEDEREQVLGKWRPAAHLSARGGAGQVPEGWIAVETRLPDDEECVLIATEDGDVWTGSHNGNGWLYVDGRRVLIKVRHWCPLPAPPADQNERDERNSKREG